MRDDPFARLGGLDQKLFIPPSPSSRTKRKAPALPERQGSGPTDERPDVPPQVRTSEVASGRTNETPSVRWPEATKERPLVRHPYDFFEDQVRWLNKMKVVVEEKYRRKITANAMVQLALDLFIRDYRRRGQDSSLVRHLVRPPHTKDGTEDRTEERTSERPLEGS